MNEFKTKKKIKAINYIFLNCTKGFLIEDKVYKKRIRNLIPVFIHKDEIYSRVELCNLLFKAIDENKKVGVFYIDY